MSEAPTTTETEVAVAEKPDTSDLEKLQTPEEQMTADETAGLTQLTSSTEPLRHSVTPAVSDFTGISNAANFLASLSRWHACSIVDGLCKNEAGGGIPYTWRLTLLGGMHSKSLAIVPTAPAITSLSPSTASIATAAGKPVTVTIVGTGLRGKQVCQVNGVTIPGNYVSSNKGFVAKYTLPAAPATVQFSIYDAATGQTSANSPFTVTA